MTLTLRPIAGRYQAQSAQLFGRAERAVGGLFRVLGPLDVDAWIEAALPLVAGLELAVVDLSVGYTVAQLEVLGGETLAPIPVVPDGLVTSQTKWLQSPVLRYRRLLSEGMDRQEAAALAAQYASRLTGSQLRRSERTAAAAGYRAHWKTREPLKYKRVLEPGACGWCRVVADQLYSAEDSGRWHASCRCSWRMLTPDEAASHEPQLDNDRWRDVINEPAGSGGGGRRKPPPAKPYASSLDRADDPGPERRRPSTKPSDVVRWGSPAAEQQFGPLLEQLDDVHQVLDDLPAMPTAIEKLNPREPGIGGWFGSSGSRMQLAVIDKGDGTMPLSFLHEFGHRIDYTGTNTYFSLGKHGTQEVRDAMSEWLKAVKDTPTMTSAATRYGRDREYLRYYRESQEIWARAYSQWAAGRLGGDSLDALAAMRKVDPLYQWPDDEFERLVPLLENVLRARGLLE